MNGKIIVGIDPGKKGAIVLAKSSSNFDIISKNIMPLFDDQYDVRGIIDVINDAKVCADSGTGIMAIIENPPPIPHISKSSDRMLAYCVGLFEGICASLDVPYMKIKPKEWQKEAWRGIDKASNAKATSMIAANSLFPGVDLKATTRCKSAHDGIVDALLMCWAFRNS